MVNIKWGKTWGSISVKKNEIREALSLPNDLMFGVWLGEVQESNHENAMIAAWIYDSILREDEIDEIEAARRRNEWSSGEGANVSDDEIERRRCGLSEWNVGQ